MSFLYDILPEYTKKTDILIDNNVFLNVKALEEYLSVIDEEIFDVMSDAIREILTYSNVFKIKEEYLPYIGFLLGYNWNYYLDSSLQRSILANILQLYKRKGTKFHFNFNLYLLDPTVEIYEPIEDIFVVGKSRLDEDHLSSREYYSPGIIVVRITDLVYEIFEIFDQIKPSGWKIIVEGKYGLYYSLHEKPETVIREYYLADLYTLEDDPSNEELQFIHSIQYVNPQLIPVVMMGQTFMGDGLWTLDDMAYSSLVAPSSTLSYYSLWRLSYVHYGSGSLMNTLAPYESVELMFINDWVPSSGDKITVDLTDDSYVKKSFVTTASHIANGFDVSDVWPSDPVTLSVFRNGVFQTITSDYTIDDTEGSEKIDFETGCIEEDDIVVVLFESISGEENYTASDSQTDFDISGIWEVGTTILAVYRNGIYQNVTTDYTIDDTEGSEKIVFEVGCNLNDKVTIQLKETNISEVIVCTDDTIDFDISDIWGSSSSGYNIYRNGIFQLEDTDYEVERTLVSLNGSFDNIKDDDESTYVGLTAIGDLILGFSDSESTPSGENSKVKLNISNISGTTPETIGVKMYEGRTLVRSTSVNTSTESPECSEHILDAPFNNYENIRVILEIPTSNVAINEACVDLSIQG